MVFSQSGCHSLRKKFIRKKKHTKEAPVYIDFKEYSDKPSKEAYHDYYVFVRGWLDELIGSLAEDKSFKRRKRAINEAVMNVEQMISFFNQEGKEEIYSLYEEIINIRDQVQAMPNMSQLKCNYLIKKTEGVKRRFEKSFTYSDAEKWMN